MPGKKILIFIGCFCLSCIVGIVVFLLVINISLYFFPAVTEAGHGLMPIGHAMLSLLLAITGGIIFLIYILKKLNKRNK